jgi:hypothetical protein
MLDYRHCLLFVLLHHGRVPDNIGKHNSGELAGLKQKIHLF